MAPRRRWGGTCLLALVLLALAPSLPLRAQPSGGDNVDLVNGCTNVSLTWPENTPIATVAAAISPAAVLQAIWKLDSNAQQYRGYNPAATDASDLSTVNPLDAVFVCMSASGYISRPPLAGGTIASGTAPVLIAPPPPPTVQIVSHSQTAGRGGSAFVSVQSRPGAWCDIVYVPPQGTYGLTAGLSPQPADFMGRATWVWTISLLTTPGQATVNVVCAGASITLTITIL
jgi:hypothetical protein